MATRYFLALVVLAVSGAADAQDAPLKNRTPNTLMAAADVPSPKATLRDVAWLQGRWTGTGLGGSCEEIWSEPAGGQVMGMFRFLKEGKPVFYEFLTLVEQDESLVLKLKHFNPDLTGWEEKADSVKFRLLKIEPDAMLFEGLTFKRLGPDRLEIFLAIRNRTDGSIREEKFDMGR
jgi:hypothetical protein